MPEARAGPDVQQAGLRGQIDGLDVQAEDLGCAEHQRGVTDRIGGREEDQPLGMVGQVTQAERVLLLEAPGHVTGVRERKPAGQPGGAETLPELEQGEGIPVCLPDDPGPDALVEGAGGDRGQQGPGRWLVQPGESQLGEPHQVIWRGRRGPRREHQRYRLGEQAAPDESKDLGRSLVEPLRVVHHDQQRLFLGHLGQEAERGQGDEEPVGVFSGDEPERHAEPPPLRPGEQSEPVEHRAAQLVQPREGQFHLGLDADPADHPEAGRLTHQVAQQGRLADPRLSPHHQDAAVPVPHAREELPQNLQLAGPAEQPGCRRHAGSGCSASTGRGVQGTHRAGRQNVPPEHDDAHLCLVSRPESSCLPQANCPGR